MSSFKELARSASNYILIVTLVMAAGIAVYSLFGDVTGSRGDAANTQQQSGG